MPNTTVRIIFFAEGAVDDFTDAGILNHCYRFDMKNSQAPTVKFTLNHEGK